MLPRGVIAVDVVEDARLEHEESAVDPAFADLRLLGEGAHQLSVEGEPAEARGRAHRRHRRELPVVAVELDQARDVDVGDAVPVRHEKGAVANPGREALDAPPGLGRDPGVDQVDEPVFPAPLVRLETAGAQVDAEAAAQIHVVQEVHLDDLALVAERQQELSDPVVGVALHDVPEDRPPADLDHRFRLVARGFL